jgi:hypothetical protein
MICGSPFPSAADQAEREWIVAARLCHPNVIQLKDVQVGRGVTAPCTTHSVSLEP